MATITAAKIIEAGVTSSLSTCAAAGDEFSNSGVEFIRISNEHATQQYTVTVTAQTTSYINPVYGKLTKSNVTKTVSAGASAYFGPFKQKPWNDANNKVQLTYTVTSNGAALSTIDSGVHKLKVEVLYLDNR